MSRLVGPSERRRGFSQASAQDATPDPRHLVQYRVLCESVHKLMRTVAAGCPARCRPK